MKATKTTEERLRDAGFIRVGRLLSLQKTEVIWRRESEPDRTYSQSEALAWLEEKED